ncbi:MAG: hypothetical protein ACKV2O_13435 [Acidimicrobiales bacterium]
MVTSPDGAVFVVRSEPAPRNTWWVNTPLRAWRAISRDRSWRITVEGERWNWPVLRERVADGSAARRRAAELERELSAGVPVWALTPAWRRTTLR